MTLQKIKSDYANEQGYLTWGLLLEEITGTVVLLNHMNEIAKRYARECCKASLEKAASAAEVTINGQPAMGGYQVERESIINPENIML